jgi:hypothetical protein
MLIKLLNVKLVLTNVVLVLITLLVLLVVKTELTFQLVIVKMVTMNKPKFVTNVTTDVKLVKQMITTVLNVMKEELIHQLVNVQPVNTN